MQLTSGKSFLRVPAKWAGHRRALLALRERLWRDRLKQICASFEPDDRISDGQGDACGKEWDFALALLSREHDALKEINDALDRIEHGAYGICEVTGLPIPVARLRAVPWMRRVWTIAQQHEAE